MKTTMLLRGFQFPAAQRLGFEDSFESEGGSYVGLFFPRFVLRLRVSSFYWIRIIHSGSAPNVSPKHVRVLKLYIHAIHAQS